MNNSEFIKNLSERLGQSQREIKRLMKCSTQIFNKILDEDLSFTIPKLGTFKTHFREKRKSFSPHHKNFMMLPPKRTVTFHPGSYLKEHVKKQDIGNE